MNINSKLLALKEIIKVNVEQDSYEGTDEKWITFNYSDDRPYFFLNGEPTADTAKLQVHFFVPKSYNYFSDKDKIQKHLEDEGFDEISSQTYYEVETKKRHIIFECAFTKGR